MEDDIRPLKDVMKHDYMAMNKNKHQNVLTLRKKRFPGCRFVPPPRPNLTSRPVTSSSGTVMPSHEVDWSFLMIRCGSACVVSELY